MIYRELVKTGLKVSEIGMGCEGFDEDNCAMTKKLFDAAEASGVNYFDLYTSNPSIREAVGNALRGRREKFIAQSHLCSVWQDGQYKRTRKLSEVMACFEESLRQLQTDYIDVGMIHYCDALDDCSKQRARNSSRTLRGVKTSCGRVHTMRRLRDALPVWRQHSR